MRWKIIVVVVLVAAVAVAMLLWKERSFTRTLPDGTRIVLSSVRIGRTNVYSHGNLLSKGLGHFAPSNGIAIAKYKIERPMSVALHSYENQDVLSAQFEVVPAQGRTNDFLQHKFNRRFRMLISGEDGFSYVKEFLGPYAFRTYADGVFGYLHADTWPRTSRILHIRLEERPSSSGREFREIASFTVRNPKPVKAEKWEAQKSYRTTLPGDLEVEVGELVVRPEPIHPTDIWEHTAELPVRFSRAGQVLTNWGFLSESRTTDATGNLIGWGAMKTFTNGITSYRLFRPVDPHQPWRFDLHAGMDSEFPETNLFRFTIPHYMAGTNATSFAGVPVTISCVQKRWLAVELPTRPKDLRVSFVSAIADDGATADDFSGSWSQHSFWKAISERKTSNIQATVAIQPNYKVSFTLQPRYEKVAR